MFYKSLKKMGLGKLYYSFFYKSKKGKNIVSISGKEANDFLLTKYHNCKTSCIREYANIIGDKYDLDIIIPAYNVERFIEECIKSVLSQVTKYTYRIIIIDDGSTDHTPEIVDKYKEDSKIVIIHQENRGHSEARNAGLNILNSKYVTFLDSDDCLAVGAIERLLDCAYENDADAVEGAYEFISSSGKLKSSEKHKSGRVEAETEYYGFPWGKIYRSSYFSMIQFPTKYWYEDSVCRQIIFPMIEKSYGIEAPVYRYRENRNGISHRSRGNIKAIDSLWITMALYNDREKLGLKRSQEYYHYMLRMAALTYERTRELDNEIQENIFASFADFLNCNFAEYRTQKEELKDLECAIRNCDFGIYSFWGKCC